MFHNILRGGVIKSYLKQDYDHILLISRHTIEHVADPHLIVRECANVEAADVRLFLETPNFHWILEHMASEDIVYEHCSFFTPKTMVALLKKYAFTMTFFENTFGGQYMCVEARKVLPFKKSVETFTDGERHFREFWESRLQAWKQQGKTVFVWGAGAKGVSFLNSLDPKRERVSAVIDINPNKQGKFLVGTGHSIISPRTLQNREGDIAIIVMNELYLEEIKTQCRAVCLKGRVLFYTLHTS